MSQDTTTTARRSATSVPETETAYRQPKPNVKMWAAGIGLAAFLAGLIFATVLGMGGSRSSRREARMCASPDANVTRNDTDLACNNTALQPIEISKRHAAENNGTNASVPGAEVAHDGASSREGHGSSEHTAQPPVILSRETGKGVHTKTASTLSVHHGTTRGSTASVSGGVSAPKKSGPNSPSASTAREGLTTITFKKIELSNEEQNSSSDPVLRTDANSPSNTSETGSSSEGIVAAEPSKDEQNSSVTEAADKLNAPGADDNTANVSAATSRSKATVEPAPTDVVTETTIQASLTNQSQALGTNVTDNVTTIAAHSTGTTVMASVTAEAVTAP